MSKPYDQDEPCDNCGHEQAKTAKFMCHGEAFPGLKQGERFYCKVCANTHLSKATDYPRQCDEPDLWKSIGWIANEILLAIAAAKIEGEK